MNHWDMRECNSKKSQSVAFGNVRVLSGATPFTQGCWSGERQSKKYAEPSNSCKTERDKNYK